MFQIHTYEATKDHSTRPQQRIDIERTQQEHQHMQSLNAMIEHQALDRHSERLQKVMLTEQLRAAGIERQSSAAIIVNRLRGAIGNMFIAAGERLRQEPVRRPELDRAPLKTARQS